MWPTDRKTILCTCAVLLGIAAKAWLIDGSSILDARDDPREYVNQVLFPGNEGVAYGPGTGLAGRFFHELGMPFRWGIEATFIVTAMLVVRALVAWPTRRYLAAGLFLFILFDPAIAEVFSHFMSDQVWMIEIMLGLALFVLTVEREDRPRAWLTIPAALFLGLSVITRSTFPPLALSFFLFVALGGWLLFKRPQAAGRFLLIATALGFGVGLIYGGTCRYNARCFGFNGISAWDNREYARFYLTLQAVGPADGVAYFPIDENHRRLIAQAGPTSGWLMGEMEKNAGYKAVGKQNYGRADFPGGWFPFAVFNAALSANPGNLRGVFALFRTVENEIDDAVRPGRLQMRPILPLPDSRLSLVLPVLPHATLRAVTAIVREPSPDWLAKENRPELYVDPDFTRALGRSPLAIRPAQEIVMRVLVHFYTALYRPLALLLLAALVVRAGLLRIKRRREFPLFSAGEIARQIFVLTFFVMACWYTLFEASGFPLSPRYLIYQHVLLPVLLAYYFVRALPAQNQEASLISPASRRLADDFPASAPSG